MYYFASDVHLGLRGGVPPRERERLFVRWLEEASGTAEGIFLLGDIFDFWYEYKRTIPQGFSRLQGKLSELSDRGVSIHLFVGNHDLWMFRYFQEECGITVHRAPYEVMDLGGRRVCLGHGDVLGPRKWSARFLSWLFRSRPVQAVFEWLHPDISIGLGRAWSLSNRYSKPIEHAFRGEAEPAVAWARAFLQTQAVDLFVFGHTHAPAYYPLTESSDIAFLGEWLEHPMYGVLGPDGFKLKEYPL